MEDIKAIEIVAEVRQIRTMVDGSVNLILNLPEECREQAKVLLDWHHLTVRGVLEVLLNNKDQWDALGQEPKRKSSWKTA